MKTLSASSSEKHTPSNQCLLFSLRVKSNGSVFNESGQTATCRLKNIPINHLSVLDLPDPATGEQDAKNCYFILKSATIGLPNFNM